MGNVEFLDEAAWLRNRLAWLQDFRRIVGDEMVCSAIDRLIAETEERLGSLEQSRRPSKP
jgi:hypothetical protein